jgi:CubicO group peptidase (beta-lactamase class C family)
MKKSIVTNSILLITFLYFSTVIAQNLNQQVDAYLASHSTPHGPGASILIAKNGKVIYKKAVGLANLELKIPLTTDNVFEIGSITKQFTSVSILMLEEQGKLYLQDEITKYIPDYPTVGKTITIHHLLNHTSGIKSYTNMESFKKNARKDMTPTELIDVFKNEPMDFDPGEKFLYNNSGYILLGHIIEVVSGESYADFIQKNIFDKIGMTSTYYGSMKKIIPKRASGYSDNNGFTNADYLSLTIPYAAGSIMSTVDDLLIWQNAINSNALIKRSSLEKAINGSTLNSGEKIPYGYGWIKGSISGSTTFEHSGGIFGYTSNGIFLPKENIYVIALSNCDCSNVGEASSRIAAMAIGKPLPDINDAITLTESEQQKWLGAYQFEENIIRYITLENGQLYSQKEGSTKLEIYPITKTKFIFESGTTAYEFFEKDGKKQTTFSNSGITFKGFEIDKAPPAEKKTITVSPEILKTYVGKYKLSPDFFIEVTSKGNQLFAQATGQSQFELFAENKTSFYLKVVVAQVVFDKNEKGDVTGLILHQGGQDIPGIKIE